MTKTLNLLMASVKANVLAARTWWLGDLSFIRRHGSALILNAFEPAAEHGQDVSGDKPMGLNVTFSPALTGAIENVFFNALEALVETHFGTTDAALIADVAPGVASIINTVTKTNLANANTTDPLVNVKGNPTATTIASTAAGIAVEAAQIATSASKPIPGQ